MIYPHSADENATKLQPSTRQQLSLVGAASEQPKEAAQVVLLLVPANVMMRDKDKDTGKGEIDRESESSSRRRIDMLGICMFKGKSRLRYFNQSCQQCTLTLTLLLTSHYN